MISFRSLNLPRPFRHPAALLILMALASTQTTPATAADPVDFGKQVYPILREHCLSCHGPTYVDAGSGKTRKPKGGLRLDTHEWIMKGVTDEDDPPAAVVVPGSPEKSTLFTSTALDPDHDDIMPATGDPLTRTQQDLLRQWIAEGAKSNSFEAPAYLNPKAKK